MNRLKLYKAAHDAAFDSLDKATKKDLDDAALAAFKAAGFETKLDFDTFQLFFYDERLKMKQIQQHKLSSELASEKV